MLRLDNVNSKLQAVLAGAITTTQPQATVCYSDQTTSGYSGGKQVTVLNSTTDVDILAAPAASTIRDVDFLSIHNRDTASITLTIKYDISATDSTIIKVTLATLETLEYTHGSGWKVVDANGNVKTSASGSPTGLAGGDLTGSYPSPTIAADAVTNAKLANMATQTIKGRTTAGTGDPEDLTLAQVNTQLALPQMMGGRLTLATLTPVMVSDVSNATTIYYTPYAHGRVSLYDGTDWKSFAFSELSQATTDNTKSPAAVANNSNYDLFVWNDAGTLRCTRGPAWTSDTARGTGAGTTELVRQDGVLLNAVSITNGPAASRGTYVGSVRSDGSAGIDWELGGSAAGGDPVFLYVWNMYNRVNVSVQCRDSTASWTTTSTTFVSLNASTSNRISLLLGLNEDGVSAQHRVFSTNAVAGQSASGIALDNTTTLAGSGGFGVSGASANNVQVGTYAGNPGLGAHFLQAIQLTQSGTGTWYGNFFAGAEDRQALTAQLRM